MVSVEILTVGALLAASVALFASIRLLPRRVRNEPAWTEGVWDAKLFLVNAFALVIFGVFFATLAFGLDGEAMVAMPLAFLLFVGLLQWIYCSRNWE